MASDEIVWQIINNQFCAFKLKTPEKQKSNFCRNEYNVTGLCTRQSCPLASSRYATVRSDASTGALYLHIKVPERVHLPSKTWTRIRLSHTYATALTQIDTHLPFWPKWLIHKCKQRLTRLTQVAIRTRAVGREEERLGEKVVSRMAPKVRRREDGRERKAERAARVERAVERELLDRLRSGAYGDRPLNVEEGVWKKVLRGLERGGEGTRDVDVDEGVEIEEEVEEELEREGDMVGDVEYVSGEETDEEDLEDLESWLGEESAEESFSDDGGSEDSQESGDASDEDDVAGGKRKRPIKKQPSSGRKKGPKLEIEYELEKPAPLREAILAT